MPGGTRSRKRSTGAEQLDENNLQKKARREQKELAKKRDNDRELEKLQKQQQVQQQQLSSMALEAARASSALSAPAYHNNSQSQGMGPLGPNPTPQYSSANTQHGRSTSMNTPATVPHQSHINYSQYLNNNSSPGADNGLRPVLQDGFRRLNTGAAGLEGNFLLNRSSLGSHNLTNLGAQTPTNSGMYNRDAQQDNDSASEKPLNPPLHTNIHEGETNHNDDDDPSGGKYGEVLGSQVDSGSDSGSDSEIQDDPNLVTTDSHGNNNNTDASDISDSGSDVEEVAAPSSKKKRKSKKKKRPRMKHTGGSVKKVLKLSLGLYKIYLCLRNAFPDEIENADLADDAWSDAAIKLGIDIDITDNMRTTIMFGSSQICGAILAKLRPYMKEYGFKTANSKNARLIQKNRALYNKLIENSNFTFVVLPDEAKGVQRAHPYQHAFVAEVLAEDFFYGKRSLGYKNAEKFKPISLPFLALIYTLVRYLISEWEKGYEVRGSFNAEYYQKDFKSILAGIELIARHPMTKAMIATLTRTMYDNARARCGAMEENDAPAPVAITEADIENMGLVGLLANGEEDD